MAVTPDIEIKPLQIWIARNEAGKVLRRIKVLAKHPEQDAWIYEEMPVGRMHSISWGVFPTFNLGYVVQRGLFTLERDV